MTEAATGWLATAADELLGTFGAQPVAGELVRARRLGAQAATASLTLPALIESFLDAAVRYCDDDRPECLGLVKKISQLTMAAMTGYEEQIHSDLSQRDRDREQFVADLLAGHTDPGRLATRAQRYGIRLSGLHTVAVARSPGLTLEITHTVDKALAARFGAGNTLTSLRDGDLVSICASGLRGVPAELAHHLLVHLGAGRWQVGIGRSHPGVHGLATSLDEAHNALDLAERLDFTAPIMYAADLLVFPVLLRDREAITDLVHTVLGPLTSARGGAQPLLDTLTVLFEQQGNHTATARVMHISVRAVTYRLDRIKALTGYHPSESTQRFTLHTAVLGARLLGWPA